MRRGRAAWIVIAAVGAATLLIVGVVRPWGSGNDLNASPKVSAQGAGATDRGIYSGAIFDRAGHLDVDQTLDRVVAAHANTYYYLMWDRAPQKKAPTSVTPMTRKSNLWQELPRFASAAEKLRVNVIVYLVPPSETAEADYLPFHWDYARWFGQIGRLASIHRNIVGIAMDDLGGNLASVAAPNKFTPTQLGDWRRIARSEAPGIKFYAVMYARDILGPGAGLPSIRNTIDGVIYPFAGKNQEAGARRNTVDASGFVKNIEKIRSVTRCETACTQLVLPRPSVGPSTDRASASSDLATKAGDRSIEVHFADDRVAGSQNTYDLQVALDGRPLRDGRRSNTETSAAIRYPLPVGTHAGQHRLRITAKRHAGTNRVVIVIQGAWSLGASTTSSGSFRVEDQGLMTAPRGGSVRTLPLIVMFYCARFTAEGTRPGAADAAYVSALVPGLRTVRTDNLADGLVAYRLNLGNARSSIYSGDLRNFGIVRTLYTQLSAHAPLVVEAH